ncbi:hypothetical protein PC2016_0392 [Pseudoalteromonas carrageenovora]|uniref:Uncharacterized protein n=1 Tax=Pseudoalteromonas carrageenovora IAM 12662 TaxID=1314868 RepID=A0A2K4X5U7_PSEVC|nr:MULTISPECIES: hypothetical protein [Pseudoalteromonas]KTF16446.1 hypothetical protein ATS74_15725 [Pseudoalteromonas sp. H103]MBE0381892.1 hypothetical protein [Pseudoalteromonas carrageenovora IAM 12662]MCQ8890507.1 hypothetical protein [Pseudoalteromonas carrageenovora]MDO6635825.1 hypothetical protein [Pseudoalteromonas carrageenovora]MDO6647818.1 hypothetical protein [Pseudoalteromonas carrageenovora]
MFLLRSFIYLLCLAGVASLIQLEGFELQQNALYSEETLTEHMQDILTLLSSILFFYASRINSQLKIACVLLATLTAMMFVREFDTYLDMYVFDGAWQAIVYSILACIFVYLITKRGTIFSSIQAYSQTPSYGICLSGLVTLLAFSRMMGKGAFWHSIMGDSYVRVVKNIVEEGIETLGYTLILISAFELVLLCRKQLNN